MRRAVPIVLLAAVGLAACSEDPPSTAVPRTEATGAIELGAPPATYRITYDVEDLDNGRVDERVVEGKPPFDVRVERTRDGDVVDLAIATFGALETGSPQQDRTAVVTHPGVPDIAPVLSGDLDAMIEQGIAEDLGERATVADRECRFVRFAGDGDDDHVDRCIDGASLVLQEEETRDGDLVRRTHATKVETDVQLEDDAFTPLGDRLPEALGGGRVRRMTDASRFPDVDFYELADAPAGWRFVGRYVVADDVEVDAEGEPGARQVALADAYERDGALLVVEDVRSTSAGAPGLALDVGVPWDVDGHPDARLLLSVGQSELRTASVRVIGTGPVADLVDVFESLVVRNGPAEAEPFDDAVDVLDE